MRVCEICKEKRVGCTKFCSRRKTEYDMCIELIKVKKRSEQREAEILNRLRERS